MKCTKNVTPGSLTEVLVSLPNASRSELLDYWKVLHAAPPPKMSTNLLLQAVAYKMQEQTNGGIKPTVKRYLEKAINDIGGSVAIGIARPGTRFIREWRGITHEVMVESDGVIMNGKKLRSLSEAAFRITGAKWSGPRFFGLVRGG